MFDPNEKGEDSGAADWILAQGEVVIHDARIRYSDRRDSAKATDFELLHVNLRLENVFGSHIVGLQAQPTSTVAGPIDLRARFRHAPFARPSDYARWTGEVFGSVDYADLAALAHTFDAPIKVKHAEGAVRSWVTFDHARITRVIADFALSEVNVTLADNLEPLTLDSLQGRVTQRVWGIDDGIGWPRVRSQPARASHCFEADDRSTRLQGAHNAGQRRQPGAHAGSGEPCRYPNACMVCNARPAGSRVA